ncbi:hypothetical protein EYZ11_005953 [Aspergillus tanneri]|uniref:Uncharacterized protein n=1 Tax=Aspergillus tanneri TaxID=1220188 RepID=A0A4V3UPC0_9EURO|nr:uncharacterized protein ATNIH1004_002270 [Aspergillus tanneri]KAA8649599.1 hypothetical protein ATNIH1004_002270 [Aspergillus tanneri]THC94554.1 hypothetical protein EYZ11_005953 [Aspergillus tanneri]
MVVSSLVRRGMEIAKERAGSPEVPSIEIRGWQAGLFFCTVAAFIFAVVSVEYTYGLVVTTLAAVEDSNPDIYVRIDGNQDGNKASDPTAPADPELLVVEAKPITSKLRTTIRHLRARGGFWSRFRGFAIFLVYTQAQGLLSTMMPVSIYNFVGQFLVRLVVGTLLANLQLAWVHIVISEPSPKRFYRRIPGYKSWVKIAPVFVFEQAIVAGAFILPFLVATRFGLVDLMYETPETDGLSFANFSRLAGAFTVPSLCSFLASIPARAIFIRVAASMLPEEDEAIVPFDRSFGGKVVPAILGGSGKLSISDAWKTFDCSARARYFKAVGKAFALEVAIVVFFSLAIVGQIYVGKFGYSTEPSTDIA